MKGRMFFVMLFCMVASLALASGGKDDETVRIGVSMSGHTSFLDNLCSSIEAQAAVMDGVELFIRNADFDATRQRTDVETMIVKGMDVIIFNPLDKLSLGHTVDMVAEAGIPLVEVNTSTDNDNYSVYVGSDNIAAGQMQGRWILKHLGQQGNVCVLIGNKSHSGQVERLQGLLGEMHSPGSKWKVLEIENGNWSRSEGKRITREWLIRNEDIHVIAAQNDEMALGALEAVGESGRSISVLGLDAESEALESVSRGEMRMTVFQDFKAQGSEALKAACDLVRGRDVAKLIDIPLKVVDLQNVNEYRDNRVSMK